MVEQLICNQQVGGSSPSTGSTQTGKLHMGEFPSGQRGQTVNLLLIASVVRIHLPPPIKRHHRKVVPFLLVRTRKVDSNPFQSNMPGACWQNQSADWFSPFCFASQNRQSNPLPPRHHRKVGYTYSPWFSRSVSLYRPSSTAVRFPFPDGEGSWVYSGIPRYWARPSRLLRPSV